MHPLVLPFFFGAALASPSFDSLVAQHNPHVIARDVAIIGGGASGTYTAIQLLDAGKSVVVVEAKDRFGGHTETYHDPATGKYDDYGVVILYNDTTVRNFYGRMGVPLGAASFAPSENSIAYDFYAKEVVADYVPKDPTEALARYGAAIAKFPFLLDGFGGMPYPVPEDLLLSVNDFLEKYNATDAANILSAYNQGVGDSLEQTMLYMAKSMNTDVLRDIATGSLANANDNNHEIYDKAQAELGDSAMVNSRVIATQRSKKGVRVLVHTPAGVQLIAAKKLVITIPPKLENLKEFDLSTEERSVFSRFRNTGYWTAILRNSGIPAGTGINNVGQDSPYGLPVLPGAYGYMPSKVPGLHDVKYGADENLSDEDVKQRILADLQSLKDSGAIPRGSEAQPEFVRFASHNPFTLTVAREDIEHGFYKRLYALQGQQNTFFTGAAWEAQTSSLLWRFTSKNVIPLILK